MMNKRTVVWIVVLVVIAALGYGAYRFFAGRKEGPPRFTTQKVDKGAIIARVTASGTLSALVTVQVGSQVSGRLMEISADFNSQVTKDQVIAKLDPELFQAAVDQAQANLLADQGNLEKAKVQAVDAERISKRSQELVAKKLIAQADADTAQANADAAKANVTAVKGQVERDRANLVQAQVNLKYTVIKSPINGVVISRSVDVGQTVAASLQAPTLFTIAEDLKKMQVDTSVAEADVGKLTPGMNATFTVDAFPGERFKGTVRQIRNAATVVQNVVTYDAVIDVENQTMANSTEFKLRPGMTANVTFIYAEKDDALRIPNAALRFHMPGAAAGPGGQRGQRGQGGQGAQGATAGGGATPPGPPPPATGAPAPSAGGGGAPGPTAGGRARRSDTGEPSDRRTVWVLRDNQPISVPIKTGITDGTLTEVVSGELHEGDDIITEAPNEASTGQRPPSFRF
jgi:HlyD family secretion protein